MHKDEAGCYEAEAENFGLEDLTSLLAVKAKTEDKTLNAMSLAQGSSVNV